MTRQLGDQHLDFISAEFDADIMETVPRWYSSGKCFSTCTKGVMFLANFFKKNLWISTKHPLQITDIRGYFLNTDPGPIAKMMVIRVELFIHKPYKVALHGYTCTITSQLSSVWQGLWIIWIENLKAIGSFQACEIYQQTVKLPVQ